MRRTRREDGAEMEEGHHGRVMRERYREGYAGHNGEGHKTGRVDGKKEMCGGRRQ